MILCFYDEGNLALFYYFLLFDKLKSVQKCRYKYFKQRDSLLIIVQNFQVFIFIFIFSLWVNFILFSKIKIKKIRKRLILLKLKIINYFNSIFQLISLILWYLQILISLINLQQKKQTNCKQNKQQKRLSLEKNKFQLQYTKKKKKNMKYHQKVNLTSPIFKYNNTTSSKKPSKSPIKTQINPTDLFQKVCCPNCKYLFKIIKQQMIKQTSDNQTPRNKNVKKQQKCTQTQGVLTLSNSNSPTKVLKSKPKFYNFNGKDDQQNLKVSQYERLNDILSRQNNQNRMMKESDFKFKPLSLSPRTKKSKSSNSLLLKTFAGQKNNEELGPKKDVQKIRSIYNDVVTHEGDYSNEQTQKSPRRSKMMKTHSKTYTYEQNDSTIKSVSTPKKLDQKLEQQSSQMMEQSNYHDSNKNSHNKFSKKYQNRNQSQHQVRVQQQKSMKQSKKSRLNHNSNNTENMNYEGSKISIQNKQQLELLLSDIILKDQQNKCTLKHLQEFCKNVAEQVEMPSFCKMLTLAIEEQ